MKDPIITREMTRDKIEEYIRLEKRLHEIHKWFSKFTLDQAKSWLEKQRQQALKKYRNSIDYCDFDKISSFLTIQDGESEKEILFDLEDDGGYGIPLTEFMKEFPNA